MAAWARSRSPLSAAALLTATSGVKGSSNLEAGARVGGGGKLRVKVRARVRVRVRVRVGDEGKWVGRGYEGRHNTAGSKMFDHGQMTLPIPPMSDGLPQPFRKEWKCVGVQARVEVRCLTHLALASGRTFSAASSTLPLLCNTYPSWTNRTEREREGHERDGPMRRRGVSPPSSSPLRAAFPSATSNPFSSSIRGSAPNPHPDSASHPNPTPWTPPPHLQLDGRNLLRDLVTGQLVLRRKPLAQICQKRPRGSPSLLVYMCLTHNHSGLSSLVCRGLGDKSRNPVERLVFWQGMDEVAIPSTFRDRSSASLMVQVTGLGV